MFAVAQVLAIPSNLPEPQGVKLIARLHSLALRKRIDVDVANLTIVIYVFREHRVKPDWQIRSGRQQSTGR
jgi:hypothetical protein